MIYAILLSSLAALAATTIWRRISNLSARSARYEANSRQALLKELAEIPAQRPTQTARTAYTATESVEK